MSDTSRTRFEPAQDLKVTDRNLKNENNFNCSLQRRILTAFLGRSAVCSETWLKGKWSYEILALIFHVRDQNHVTVFFDLIHGFIISVPILKLTMFWQLLLRNRKICFTSSTRGNTASKQQMTTTELLHNIFIYIFELELHFDWTVICNQIKY